MADDMTDIAAQAKAIGDELLTDLASAASSSPASAVSRIKKAAEDAYWAPRRQMERAIAARTAASARAAAANERIAQLKQQIGT
jgi:geranylgeranyl pyrophosphate synthase